jgi:hypothetical protein
VKIIVDLAMTLVWKQYSTNDSDVVVIKECSLPHLV